MDDDMLTPEAQAALSGRLAEISAAAVPTDNPAYAAAILIEAAATILVTRMAPLDAAQMLRDLSEVNARSIVEFFAPGGSVQ